MTSRLSLGKAYFWICFLAFAIALCASSQPPFFRDYPDWVYQGNLLAKAMTGHPVPGYALKHYPVPNSITTIGIAVLTLLFGWLWAAKLWMLVYFATAAVIVMRVSKTFGLAEWLWWVVPTAMFLGQSLWFGTISFNFGLCAILLLADWLYRDKVNAGAVIAWFTLCFFLHLLAYAAAGLLVLLYCLERRRWKLVALYATTLPLPIWYFLGKALHPAGELAAGGSSSLHMALPVVITLLFLALAARWNSSKLSVWSIRLCALAACACLFLVFTGSFLHLPASRTVATLAWLKLLAPFQFFGFVNIIYFPADAPLLSATLRLFGQPLFLFLAALDVLCGAVLLAAIAGSLVRGQSDSSLTKAPVYLKNFVALFAVLYFVSPPNAMGVISIDLRLAQFAVAIGLLVFAGRAAFLSTVWRLCTAAISSLLVLSSLYQVVLSQRFEYLQGADTTTLPLQVAHFGAVDPTAASEEYDRLRSGNLQGFIFATGMLYATEPWTLPNTRGR